MPSPVPAPRAAATPVSGLRTVQDLPTQRNKMQVDDKIHLIEPSAAPFTLLTQAIKGSQQVGRYDYDWLTEDPYPRELTVSGAQTAGDTAIEVEMGHGNRAAKYFVYKNRRTREVIRVSSINSDTLTVVRGIGADRVPAAAMVDGDVLELIGTAFEQAADIGTLKSVVQERQYNYTQIFRTQYGHEGRNIEADLYGGRDPKSTRQSKMKEHKVDQELSAFFGHRDSFTGADGELVTMTGGLEYFIQSNVFDFSGTGINERSFVEMLEYAMKYGDGGHVGIRSKNGSAMKYAFLSRRWITEIEFWAKDRLRIVETGPLAKFGLKLNVYQSTHGDLALIPMNCFVGEHNRYGFIVDMNHADRVHFRNRDTAILEDRGGNGVDGYTEEIRTDAGWKWSIEVAHSKLILPSA